MRIRHNTGAPAWSPAVIFIILFVFFRRVHGHGHRPNHVHHARSHSSSALHGSITDRLVARQSALADSSGQVGASFAAASSSDFTCGPRKECSNGACCGVDGWCGYGPTYCGDGCQSNCNATAECGEFADVAGKTCPLHVCCSKFGFCGTTTLFCTNGCQSNCEQPKPDTGGSNTQQRVIGYWEAWNLDHACGTMNPSEIPVHMLTHLNVAFGYVDSNFRVTNMDGISPELYKQIPNLKYKNPNLKVMIALGGWSFSDPGPWQSIFPTLASTPTNRATFIQNLLGFLSTYGYDGVDFDWEYPGADDRGGSEGDGENFTALLQELRTAIDESDRSYLVTFTAPSSYWYLRHFDLKGMTQYVDWINLMSYDLHGIWDSSNPIGSQVLAHTNLTEIDLALDLFWRNDIEPSKIVLGLGFYGRSFQLTSASCWKPGCAFDGPGVPGACTQAAGILSYREITEILATTGAKAHFDEAAAVKYLVYAGNSWISFDDAETFKLKIEYANGMGLGGLMIWAIDQDNNDLDALRAITDATLANDDNLPFTLVDLEKLFPQEYLPGEDSKPRYGLVNFGSEANQGSTDPNATGFGFFLVAGESYAVAKLKKRKGHPEPFTFIDCPSNVLQQPDDTTQTARVVCLNSDVEGCFRVLERGVEGTLVEMPENCAFNTFARAISLNVSDDQSLPLHLSKRATSVVFDFTFDYDFKLVRKDSAQTSIRLDYSSIPGYWDDLVDSEGIQSKEADPERLRQRFFSQELIDWNDKFNSLNIMEHDHQHVKKSLSQPLYWQSVDSCLVDGDLYGEGFGVYVDGSLDVDFGYGFTLVAWVEDGKLHVTQSAGMLYVKGSSDLTYSIGGVGQFDVGKANVGNPAWYPGAKEHLHGHTMYTSGMKGWAAITPYIKLDYMMATRSGDAFSDSSIGFNGLLGARIQTTLGPVVANLPSIEGSGAPRGESLQAPRIEIPESNIVYGSGPGLDTAKIALACYVSLGLKVDFGVVDGDTSIEFVGPDASLRFDSMVEFTADASSGSGTCVDYTVSSVTRAELDRGGDMGPFWEREHSTYVVFADTREVDEEGLCYPDVVTKREIRASVEHEDAYSNRTLSTDLIPREDGSFSATSTDITLNQRADDKFPGWGWVAGEAVVPLLIFKGSSFTSGSSLIENNEETIKCRDCLTCSQFGDENEGGRCCGCVSMDYKWGYSDIPPCYTCNEDVGVWPGTGVTSARSVGTEPFEDDESNEDHWLGKRVSGIATITAKKGTVCGRKFSTLGDARYPSFPSDASWPWDGIQQGKWDSISKYWGNSSADCADWGVTKLTRADVVNIGGRSVRAKYQTEHVFEAQIVGDFFSSWLDQGQVPAQVPAPQSPSAILSCDWTKKYILAGLNWDLDGKKVPFFRVLLAEMGSLDHLERLTIYLARPNQKKGAMFTGSQPTAHAKYRDMSVEEQLLSVKEMGMLFNYLNNNDVWNRFCASYEALWDRFGEFDEWWLNNQGVSNVLLQSAWKDYVREVLDSLVRRSRDTFDAMYNDRK
ncbi:hypothetical protein DL768_008713 [Monosporascus sp. mg162]|nr:hypothetical protein DL768_008713 [Monosporascus sp. mg162]